ncbi:MAG: hypothetical protein Q4G13_03075 [Moraxella sp.]|nr:hypothetical protein [Moraxella sp.]
MSADYLFDDVHSRYRYYSRRVFTAPTAASYHEQRIMAAADFQENEPLQGALADYFYACWYDVVALEQSWLAPLLDRLSANAKAGFWACINRQNYLWKISHLATRWSVLVTPSLDVAAHKLRISRDDAFSVSAHLGTELVQAKNSHDLTLLHELEQEFFAHCLACQDRMAFMKLWFRLAKENWDFHDGWRECGSQLDIMASSAGQEKDVNLPLS